MINVTQHLRWTLFFHWLGFEAGATKDNQGKEVLDISEKGVVGFVM